MENHGDIKDFNDFNDFNKFAKSILARENNMSIIFNGNTVFNIVNNPMKRDLESITRNRKDWIVNNYFDFQQDNDRKQYENYYDSDIVDSFQYDNNVSNDFINKPEKNEIINREYYDNNIGTFYDQFQDIFKKENEIVETDEFEDDEYEEETQEEVTYESDTEHYDEEYYDMELDNEYYEDDYDY